MKTKEIEYSRTFNLGQFESERIGLTVELEETEDLNEAFRNVKAHVFRLYDESRFLEVGRKLEKIKEKFPDKWLERLDFSLKGEYFIVKPRYFLRDSQFAKLASLIRDLGGEYASAGKDSHFKIPISQTEKVG